MGVASQWTNRDFMHEIDRAIAVCLGLNSAKTRGIDVFTIQYSSGAKTLR